MSTHNICFHAEIKKNIWIPPLILIYVNVFDQNVYLLIYFVLILTIYVALLQFYRLNVQYSAMLFAMFLKIYYKPTQLNGLHDCSSRYEEFPYDFFFFFFIFSTNTYVVNELLRRSTS